MKLEQHIYTSGKTEFTTIAATSGINRDERIRLENHSLYILPGTLLYKDDQPKPTKYIFYPLDEYRLVIGRAIYIGKDSLGRPGNYLFHNFIIYKEDFMWLNLNPARLIKLLEGKELFRDKIPEEPLNVIELPVDEMRRTQNDSLSISRIPSLQRDLILNLVYFCFNHKSLQRPLLLTGTDKEYLDFLEWLYNLLPYNLREKISFDTYSYGTNLGFPIMGIPDEVEFQQNISYSLKLDLKTWQYTTNFELKEPSKLISFIAEMAAEGRAKDINSMYSLEYCLQKGDYTKFKVGYKTVSPEIKDFLYTSHRETILNYITTKKDVELLEMITAKITVEDVNILSSDYGVIERLVDTDNRRIIEVFVDWLCTKGDKRQFHPLLFKSCNLWRVFLERIRCHPQNITLLIEPVSILPAHYSREFEDILLEETINLLPYIRADKRLSKHFSGVLDNLPHPGFADSELLRTFVRYELSKDPLLLKRIIESDVFILSERYQTIVLDSLLNGIIRSGR